MRLDRIGVDESDFRDADAGESFCDQGADAAEANYADSKVLDVPLCTYAPSVDGAALEFVVF